MTSDARENERLNDNHKLAVFILTYTSKDTIVSKTKLFMLSMTFVTVDVFHKFRGMPDHQ
jgi:hypothetical protein